MHAPHPTRSTDSRGSALLRALLVVFLFSSIALGARWVGGAFDLRTSSAALATPRTVVQRGELASDEQATIALFRAASPSVVHINTARLVRRGWFNANLTELPEGTGSGFLWDDHGHVVTNYHVIRGADTAEVVLADKTALRATLVGSEPSCDIAVLRVDLSGQRSPPLPIGTSADLQVGQKVFAIGNPFGFDQTLTTGVISGLEREIRALTGEAIRGVVQTDAAINPGNSGGPLLDSAGRLIGINTAIVSPSGAYAGIGFAVPVDTVQRIVPRLLAGVSGPRAGLGITLLRDDWARSLGARGAVVAEVLEGGAAAEAGFVPARRTASGEIELGDVVLELDGERLEDGAALREALMSHEPGDRVRVRVKRGQKERELELVLRALSVGGESP